MKKTLNAIWQNKFFYILAFSVLLFSACKKEDVPETPVSGLMAFNLIPDKDVAFVLSNNSLTNAPLSYTNYTGNYLSVYSGNREVKLYEVNTDSALATTGAYLFEPKMYYSIFALGANDQYRNVIVNDNLDSLPTTTGQAFVRYINAIPDSSNPMVTINENGTDIVNDAAAFADVSDFKGIDPGEIMVKVNDATNFSADRTFTVEKDNVYTILLVGMPAATDTAKAVKIKYIKNGVITPNS